MARGNDFPKGKKYYSVSQFKQMKDCPHQYWLQRRERAWQKPAAWLAHGIAFHAAGEEWERSGRTLTTSEVQDVFRDAYVDAIEEATAITPNLTHWFWSGPYDGKADIERRFKLGLEQVDQYIDYYERVAPREVVWITPDGEPAIELPFDVEFGGVRVVGYIDKVEMVPDPVPKPKSKSKAALAKYAADLETSPLRPRPRDLKSGALPGDAFQLGVYDAAIAVKYGVKCDVGDYWMAKRAKPTAAYDLSEWTVEAVTEEFQKLDEAVKAERFEPKPGEQCRRCPVASSCSFSFA